MLQGKDRDRKLHPVVVASLWLELTLGAWLITAHARTSLDESADGNFSHDTELAYARKYTSRTHGISLYTLGFAFSVA